MNLLQKAPSTHLKIAMALITASLSTQVSALSLNDLPAEVQVPSGHKVALYTKANGNITWECKTNAESGAKWSFAGPRAILSDKNGNHVVSYFGPPATWESLDGSSITGKQIAISPSKPGSIPMQLVKANPSEKKGILKGVSYIQRINLNGGAAPKDGCSEDKIGHKIVVNYSGAYLFYKPE